MLHYNDSTVEELKHLEALMVARDAPNIQLVSEIVRFDMTGINGDPKI